MIKKLVIKNGIKHHNTTFNFEEGLTSITGKNGSGKSLILEFIRFALFGSKALRGTTSDYDKLKVELEFEVRGKPYIIHRTLLGGEIKTEGEILAIGTTSLNAKVIEILGYNLTIFDMANCANQEKLTELGKMTPTERKNAVDKVIGLSVIDEIVDHFKLKKKETSVRLETISEFLTKPEKPTKPEGYRKASEVLEDYKAKSTLNAKLEASGDVPLPDFLLADTNRDAWEDAACRSLEDLQRFQHIEKELAREIKPTLTKEKISLLKEDWSNYKAYSKMPPKPVQSLEELGDMGKRWELINSLPTKHIIGLHSSKVIRDQWEAYETNITAKKLVEAAKQIICPECTHEFLINIDKLTLKQASFEVEKPKYSLSEVAIQEDRCNAWLGIADEDVIEPELPLYKIKELIGNIIVWKDVDIEPCAEPDVTEFEMKQAEDAHVFAETLKGLKVEYANLKLIVHLDVEEQIEIARKYFICEEYRKELAKLPKTSVDVLQKLAIDCELYERENNVFVRESEAYVLKTDEIIELKEKVKNFAGAVEGLRTLKKNVKQYLIPSLTKVASALANKMSGGKFTEVNIDADFNITTDGLKICLLSGSESAIVNLALRLSLGQVLTNRTFSLFMGDELDASMEEERAEEVANALESLTKTFKQIVVVSHKNINCDQEIQIK